MSQRNGRKALIPDITLESLAEKLEGEDNEDVLWWLRMALQWNPEDRRRLWNSYATSG